MFIVSNNEKETLKNLNGEYLFRAGKYNIHWDGQYWVLIDSNNSSAHLGIVIPKCDRIIWTDSGVVYNNEDEKKLIVIQNGKYVLYDSETGKKLRTAQIIRDFHEGLSATKIGGEWGYIDVNGDWVILPQFSWCTDFSYSLAYVEGETTGLIYNPIFSFDLLEDDNSQVSDLGMIDNSSKVYLTTYDITLLFDKFYDAITKTRDINISIEKYNNILTQLFDNNLSDSKYINRQDFAKLFYLIAKSYGAIADNYIYPYQDVVDENYRDAAAYISAFGVFDTTFTSSCLFRGTKLVTQEEVIKGLFALFEIISCK